MKILFEHPEPFFLAHGGFQIQIEQTKLALEAHGVDVEWLRWWDGSQRGDIIHFFGRPHPAHILMAQASGLKTVFTELLTAQGSRSAYRRAFQEVIGKVGRLCLPKRLSEKIGWPSYQLADAIIALTPWEAYLMAQLYGAPREKIQIVGNGVEKEFFFKPESGNLKREVENEASPQLSGLSVHPSTFRSPLSDSLICTATITERKRVLELAEAAILAKTRLLIIGKPYYETDPYYVRFLEVVGKSDGIVRYGGEISNRQELADQYRSARGFALLSTMESQSLSALEAAASGIPLLLADLPWAHASFGESATYCPLGSLHESARALRQFYDSCPTSQPPPPPKSWEEIALQLKWIYGEILKTPKVRR
jgi:glycosyltransferase involved in cell wall biosynthesis